MSTESNQPTILIVDDIPENIQVAIEILKNDYKVLAANNGESAIKIATKQHVDAIILDVMMPNMDGFEVCRQLKADALNSMVPIIFLTALDSPDDIQKGLDLGAFYYLTKPVNPDRLLAIVNTATENFCVYQALQEENSQTIKTLSLITDGHFHFQTLQEARGLAVLIAKICPEPDVSIIGFTELMVNAVEHGNLGITYEEKSELSDGNCWNDEVERRLELPENADKFVTLYLQRNPEEIIVTIHDEGPGFDWKDYLEITAERAMDSHGRGIAMAKAFSFEYMEYLGKGNEVTVKISAS